MSLEREIPWNKARPDECYFYQTMKFSDAEIQAGSWTIPDFANYIGEYDVSGKSVLDVGSASGFLAFNAERAGAIVTGFEAPNANEFRHFPFASTVSYRDQKASRDFWTVANLGPIKRSWWYAWHSFGSRAECIYAPIEALYTARETFDVVLAGAIVEHLSDPVYAVGAWTRVAREAVIVPFTEVADDDNPYMQPLHSMDDPTLFYIWWRLSRGLWNKLFDNLGFDVTYTTSTAIQNDAPGGPQAVSRPTIIAVRRPGTWETLNSPSS